MSHMAASGPASKSRGKKTASQHIEGRSPYQSARNYAARAAEDLRFKKRAKTAHVVDSAPLRTFEDENEATKASLQSKRGASSAQYCSSVVVPSSSARTRNNIFSKRSLKDSSDEELPDLPALGETRAKAEQAALDEELADELAALPPYRGSSISPPPALPPPLLRPRPTGSPKESKRRRISPPLVAHTISEAPQRPDVALKNLSGARSRSVSSVPTSSGSAVQKRSRGQPIPVPGGEYSQPKRRSPPEVRKKKPLAPRIDSSSGSESDKRFRNAPASASQPITTRGNPIADTTLGQPVMSIARSGYKIPKKNTNGTSAQSSARPFHLTPRTQAPPAPQVTSPEPEDDMDLAPPEETQRDRNWFAKRLEQIQRDVETRIEEAVRLKRKETLAEIEAEDQAEAEERAADVAAAAAAARSPSHTDISLEIDPYGLDRIEREAAHRKAGIARKALEPLVDDADDFEPGKRYCPFCDKEIMQTMSEDAEKMLARMLRRRDATKRLGTANPNPVNIPPRISGEFCYVHFKESITIPKGQAAGYPSPEHFDWNNFEKRVAKTHKKLILALIDGTQQSDFKDAAVHEYVTRKRRLDPFASFETEIPGYYGTRGYEGIYKAIQLNFTMKGRLRREQVEPIDPTTFMRRVLIPEVGMALIREDLACSREESLRILEESRDYGMAINVNVAPREEGAPSDWDYSDDEP
ncbi:hypothetical protein E5Q_01446 [Mixia osmundae IAM 14324]|uniref:Restriction of telomere capping protein 4 n=1 Tax=Mixia osmundae (strain CBS 9802 / IAM 14324 / JCM 22182 / KY 12970) TaxID=764103 RepID=G7DWA4_MIXOS|nr:hypothetical protein E5Q_01446 [Mixia osmundae IAM 14324]